MKQLKNRALKSSGGGLGMPAYLAAALGPTLGIGWLTIVGSWLVNPGPFIAMCAWALGSILTAGKALCYAELAGMMPLSGGVILYTHKAFGRVPALVVGWIGLSIYVSNLAFLALSLAWVLEALFPIAQSPVLFHFLGVDITLLNLISAQASLWGLYAIHRRGLHASALTLEILTLGKVVIIICFILGGLLLGRPERAFESAQVSVNLHQLWAALGLVAAAPFWITGYSTIAILAGDRDPKISMRTLGFLMLATVAIGALFYIGVVLATAAAAPLNNTIHADMPAAFAANAMFGSAWAGRAILVAGLAGILATMDAAMLSSSRILSVFHEIAALREPGDAANERECRDDITLIVVVAAIAAFSGKGALLPLVNSGAIASLGLSLVACLIVVKLRVVAPNERRPFVIPGGIPMLAAISILIGSAAIFLIAQPLFLASEELLIEWGVLIAWSTLGVFIGRRLTRRELAQGMPASSPRRR